MAKRLSRAEQGERNRALVLAAARRVFLERGYAGATLEAIAEDAGFSKGVVYSQFAGKPDLFLALIEGRIAERAERNLLVLSGLAGLDGVRALLDANARLSEEGGDWSRLLIEFRVIAARDPVLNARYAALHAQTIDHFTETIASILARAGLTSAYPPRAFAELILAIDAGRVLERAAGTSESQLEHLVDLLGRALVPAGFDDNPSTSTPPPGGHDAHHDRTEHSFPALRDGLKAGLLAGYPELIERLGWSRARIAAHQQDQLGALLTHAIEHSPFHARRLRGIDPAAVDVGDLSQLPVMTKAEMMAELDDVFTDRRLTRAAVERALADAGPEPATLLGSCLALTTGGSSGRRGVFVLDRPAAVQFFGTLTRGLVARLEAMGGPPPGGLPIAMVAAGSPVHATGSAAPLCAGEAALPFRFLGVPVTQPLSDIVAQLNALQAAALYGYPSVLARLAREREAGRLRISPMVITSTSETCTPELRAAITSGFGAPLIDSFGSTEGLVGASAPDDDVITFAEDGCIVELVDEHHRPVPPGTPSASVLVTNLSNRLQPLIRYELTDTFVRQPAASEHGYLRARVSGRSDESFRYGEVTVHPLVIRTVMVRSRDVADYQVRQTAAGIDVTVVAEDGHDLEALRVDLSGALGGAGLPRPAVTVRSVPHLQRDAATGKLRRFVPLP